MSILKICCIIACLFFLCCEPTSPNDDPCDIYKLPRLPLYAVFEGSPVDGILLIDLDSLMVVDSLTIDRTSYYTRISPDSTTLYLPSADDVLLVRSCDFSILGSIEFASPMLEVSIDGNLLFLSGITSSRAFTVMDEQTEEILLTIDTILVRNMATDPVQPGVFVAYRHIDSTYGTNGIIHFDAETMTIDRWYSVGNYQEQGAIIPSCMVVTHDGAQLLFTDYIGGGFVRGSILYHLDLVSGEYQAKTYIDAGRAFMAITPDDQYVYITDDGIHLSLEVIPSGILRRYDLDTRSITDFIDFRQFDISPGFNDHPLLGQIVLFPNPRTCVITSSIKGADIMVVDLVNGELLGRIGLAHNMERNQRVVSAVLGPATFNSNK